VLAIATLAVVGAQVRVVSPLLADIRVDSAANEPYRSVSHRTVMTTELLRTHIWIDPARMSGDVLDRLVATLIGALKTQPFKGHLWIVDNVGCWILK